MLIGCVEPENPLLRQLVLRLGSSELYGTT